MSGVTGFEAAPYLTPDEVIASNKHQSDTTRKIVNILAAQVPALVGPDPNLTEMTGGPGALNYAPFAGAANMIGGMVSGVSDALGTVRNLVTGRNDDWQLPGMQTMRTMGEHYTKAYQDIQKGIETGTGGLAIAPDPNSNEDQLLDIGVSALSMGLPTMATGLAKVAPKGAKLLQQFLLPTIEDAPKLTAIGSGVGVVNVGAELGLQEIEKREEAAAAPVPSFNEFLTKTPELPQTVQVAQASSTATDVLPTFADYLKQPPTAPAQEGVPTFADYLSTETQTPGPTFQQTGVGTLEVWKAFAALAGVGAAVAGGKLTHRIGATMTEAGRTARYEDPVYAAKAKAYNDAKIRRGGSEISEGLEPPEPPPLAEANPWRQATNAANTAVLNEHAQMQDAIRMMGNPTNAERLAHQYGMVHNDMAASTKLDAFIRTGYHPDSGVQMPSFERVSKRIGSLNAAEEKVVMDGLSAADEKNNRDYNRAEFNKKNPSPWAVPKDEEIRHNFKNQSDADLQVIIDRMMSDPKLADGIAKPYWEIGQKIIDVGEKIGYFTKAEANQLRATHKHYVPEVGKDGKILHPLGPRDKTIVTGVDQVNSKPWFNMAQHIQEIHRAFELNSFNRDLVESFRDGMRKNPGAAQFIYDVPGATTSSAQFSGGPFREGVVTIRTSSGPKHVRVDHPDVLNALSGDSLKRSHILSEMLTVPRRLYQKGTTGSLSLASGSVSSIINPTYTSAAMAVNAPKGTYGGLVSKGVQKLTGHDSGVARGIDMVTNLPGVGYSYARGLADRQIGRTANWLDRGATNPLNRELRALLGDHQVDGMQRALDNFYLNTRTNQMRQMGMSGQGIPVKSDLPALQTGATQDAKLAVANNVPGVYYAGKWKIPGTDLATKPFFVKLDRIVEEAMANMSDAGHDYFARLNWDNPNLTKEQLAYETRNLTGDPGVKGASTGLRYATSIIPYSNIALQGTSRLGRSIGERPVNAAMTMATGLGTMALAQILTHMQSDQHMEYLQNDVSLQQRGANVVLATDDDPTKGTMIRLPQELRPAYALMLDLVSKAVNIVAMRRDGDVYTGVLEGIKDFFGGHITQSNEDAILHGVADITGAVNLPPLAGRIDHNKVFHGKGLFDAYSNPLVVSTSSLPNQVPDGPLDDNNGKVFAKIISGVFGLAGTAMMDTYNNAARYATQMDSWAEGLGTAGRDWLQGFQDRNPQLNTIWEHQLRLSTQSPVMERTQREIDWMSKITGARTEPGAEGYTGRGRTGLPVPTSEESKVPKDPQLQQMYLTIQNYHSRMAPQLAEIKDIRQQMGAVQSRGFSQAEKREWMNERTRDLSDKYRFLHDVVQDVNHSLSQIAGRPVQVGQHIDWQGGMDQFD